MGVFAGIGAGVFRFLMPDDFYDEYKSTKVTDHDHSGIHDGKHFKAWMRTTFAAGATRYIAFTTAANDGDMGYVHWRPVMITPSVDKVTMKFYRSPEGVTGGSAVTFVNQNENSSTTSIVTMLDNVTRTANGTLIAQAWLPGSTGVGQARQPSTMGQGHEKILLPSTTYLYEIINGSSASNDIEMEFDYYIGGKGF